MPLRLIQNPLAKSSKLKLRKWWKEQNELQHQPREKTIVKNLGYDNANDAYYHLAEIYNDYVKDKRIDTQKTKIILKQLPSYDLFSDVNKEKEAKKVIRNILKQEINANRYNLINTETAHGKYNMYSIPSYDEWITYRTHFVNLISGDNVYLSMNEIEVNVYARLISTYASIMIKNSLKRFKGIIKVYLKLNFKAYNQQEQEEFEATFNTRSTLINSYSEFVDYVVGEINRGFETYDGKDYITLYGFNITEIHVLQYNPLIGSSYKPLPDFVANSKSVINIKNTDNLCFLWCCIASRHLPEKNADRVSKYHGYVNEFHYDESDFPMAIKNISKFEKKNNVCVNVFTIEEKTKVPLYISKHKNDETINLFYHDNHFSLIKNFQRFVGGDHKFVCYRCFKSYRNKECFDKHESVCQELNENGSYVTTPKEDTTTKFNNYKRQKRLPVVIYADFESSLLQADNYTKNNKTFEKSYITAKHEANSFRIRIVSDVELRIPLDYSYTGTNASVEFIRKVVELDTHITDVLNELNTKQRFPKLTREEEKHFKTAVNCCFCCQELGDDRVHCHFTGKYTGASHKKCNVKAIQMMKGKTEEKAHIEIPCFFHNANYDIRCFINAFSEITNNDGIDRISGVPCNMEFFKCLQLNNICIKDSYAHLSSSLDKLIKNLPDDKKKLLKTIIGTDEYKFNLINKKGFYPYEFVDSIEKLQTPITELKQEHFKSKLTLSELSNEDWCHIQKVIKEFNIKTLQDYHDLYLNIDVYGLADVFEYHRELSLQTYGLDPAHYIGLPGLSWDAGLKFTGIELENISEIDMIMFWEKMKRGGISVISKRYAKANNPYLPDYNPNQQNSYILQLDCNNLYGWAMMQKLPVGKFEWVEPSTFEISKYDKAGDIGYVLEVDMKYPEELHVTHNDYPLAPEHLEINGCRKLCPNLQDKKNYYTNIDNLHYYLEKGLILERIHRIIRFDRRAWLKPYIDKNSALRQKASNDFEKDFYKLMNNAFYGKTMENERDRVNIKFCMNETTFSKHTSSPLFANQILVIKSDGLCLVKVHKKIVRLQKPIYTGAIVLEMSKLLMFQFHYDTMMKAYPKAEMCKTDTDSLLYYIQTDDVYKDMEMNVTLQDKIEFSNYPKDHHLYNCDRKKVPGYFQDECVDGKFVVISEYVGLRAKSYVNNLYDSVKKEYTSKKKSKGVASVHIKKRITFDDYHNVLMNKTTLSLDNIISFRSIGLHTYTINMKKIALSGNDDKRIILANGIDTYAYGHKLNK